MAKTSKKISLTNVVMFVNALKVLVWFRATG